MKIMMFVMCVMLNLANINTPTYYARVSNNAYLYSQKNVSSALFVLPESYYVKLTSDCGEYYKVRYDNLSGYVKKDSVTPVIGKPKTPFLSGASFRVFTSDGATLRTTPTKNSTITTTLPINKEIRYYGSIVGDELISNRGNIWYFAEYIKNGQSYLGYVYSGLSDMLTGVEYNNEQLTITTNPFTTSQQEYINTLQKDKPFITLLIIGVSLPGLFVIYLLFKPIKINKGLNKTKLKKIPIIEYDDKEL